MESDSAPGLRAKKRKNRMCTHSPTYLCRIVDDVDRIVSTVHSEQQATSFLGASK